MKFLEAQRILAKANGGVPLPFLFATSGTAEPLVLFLRAIAAKRGRSAEPRTLPFNTMQQLLLEAPGEAPELFLLMPWDLAPETDWRSGIPRNGADRNSVIDNARRVAQRIAVRPRSNVFYLPAPLPPLFSTPGDNASMESELIAIAGSVGAHILPRDTFSLTNYFASGQPIGSDRLGAVASTLMESLLPPSAQYKLLVTDLDNVMWHGVIGEDGPDGIAYGPEGLGYRFFVYQSFLARLRHQGVLLAAVSRNDPDLALRPFRSGQMVLKEQDLVAVIAGYGAKSAQIRELTQQLNLGHDAVVFVDDNPVELEEVGRSLPAIECVRFPAHDGQLPGFLNGLTKLFGSSHVTEEDRKRTELYRVRLAGMVPREADGADLHEFLQNLQMKLYISDRSNNDRRRAVQLINKTNQFNLNGERLDDEEVARILADGGRLYAAALEDKHGSHGEILACLINGDGTIRSLVMSCRVLERRVEYAFMGWLAGQADAPRVLAFNATERNAPFQRFLTDAAFEQAGDGVLFDPERFLADHRQDLALFEVIAPSPAQEQTVTEFGSR